MKTVLQVARQVLGIGLMLSGGMVLMEISLSHAPAPPGAIRWFLSIYGLVLIGVGLFAFRPEYFRRGTR